MTTIKKEWYILADTGSNYAITQITKMSRTSSTGLCVLCQVHRPHFSYRKNIMNLKNVEFWNIDFQWRTISRYNKDSIFFISINHTICKSKKLGIVQHFLWVTIFWSYCHPWKKTLVCGLSMITDANHDKSGTMSWIQDMLINYIPLSNHP